MELLLTCSSIGSCTWQLALQHSNRIIILCDMRHTRHRIAVMHSNHSLRHCSILIVVCDMRHTHTTNRHHDTLSNRIHRQSCTLPLRHSASRASDAVRLTTDVAEHGRSSFCFSLLLPRLLHLMTRARCEATWGHVLMPSTSDSSCCSRSVALSKRLARRRPRAKRGEARRAPTGGF